MPWSWCWGLRHDVSGAWPCHQPGSWPSLALQNRGQQARQLKQCLPVSWGWRDRVTAQRDSLAKQVPAPWLTLWPRLATYLSLLGEPRQVCSLMEGPHSLLLHHQRHRNRRLKPKLLPQPTAARITRLSCQEACMLLVNEPSPLLSPELCSLFQTLSFSSHSSTIAPSGATPTGWSQYHHCPEGPNGDLPWFYSPSSVSLSKHRCLVLKVRV